MIWYLSGQKTDPILIRGQVVMRKIADHFAVIFIKLSWPEQTVLNVAVNLDIGLYLCALLTR